MVAVSMFFFRGVVMDREERTERMSRRNLHEAEFKKWAEYTVCSDKEQTYAEKEDERQSY